MRDLPDIGGVHDWRTVRYGIGAKGRSMIVAVDVVRPGAPIMYKLIDGNERDWEPSTYQTADLSIEERTPKAAWRLVNDWLKQQ